MNKLPERRFGAVLSLFAATSLFAVNGNGQTTAASDQTDNQSPQVMEKYVVTGTNIPTAADALAVPVTVLGPQQIETSGVETNALDILRKTMPMIAGNGNIGAENATINSNATFGGSMIALHNMTTLVLINGRRVAFDPAEGEGGFEFVDLNMIPVSAIDRIDVLNDGASAIYGSDAVGGVVNIILKNGYNGWQAGVHFGESPNQGHYRERMAYLSGGVSSGPTSISVSAEYEQNDPIYMFTRPYTNPIYGTSYYPGIIDVFNLASGSDQRYKLNSSVNAPPGGGQYTIDQLVANGTYIPETGSQVTHGFNLANYQTLIGSNRRRSVVVDATHEIFGKQLAGFGDVIYSNTYTQSSLNGQPIPAYVSDPYIDVQNVGATPPPPGNAYIPVGVAGNPFSQAWMDQGAPADGSAGNIVTVHSRNFTFPRLSQQDSTLLRGVAGLRGDINQDYSWEAAMNLDRYALNFRNPGVVSTANWNAAVAAGKLNPFAYTQPAGVLPGNIIGAAFVNMISTLNSFDFKVTGKPLELPAGQLGFAVGASFTREGLSADPDVNSIPDANGNIGWLFGVSMQPFNAHRTVSAGYLEVEAPITGPAMGIPGLHSLNVDLAGRYENYSRVGTSRVPKVSLKWEPFDDQFIIRGSAGKSFAAPILYDLFGPITTGSTLSLTFNNYDSTGKPTGQQTQLVQFNSQSGANPSLQPSTATTVTGGFVVSPHAVKGLSFSVDYFQTVEKNLVGSFDQPTVAQSVEQLGPQSPYASTVHFGSYSGHGVTAPGQLSTANPSSVYLVLPLVNLASQAVKGWDATVEYMFDTSRFGSFDASAMLSGYNSYMAQAVPTQNYYQYAGHASSGVTTSVSQGTIPRWRSYVTLNWKLSGFGVTLADTYVPSVTDIGTGGVNASPPTAVGSFQEVDGALSYSFKHLSLNRILDGLTVRVGVNNAFNKLPPIASNAFPDTNSDVSTYGGAIGRMYYFDASVKF